MRVRKNISVDKSLWERFEEKCSKLGNKMSNRLELLMEKDLKDGED